MPIRAKCPGCAAVVGAPDAAAGKKVKCPMCGGLIPVPEAVSDFEVVEGDAPPPAAKPVVAKAVAVKPKPKAEFEVVDDGEDDEPPPKPKKKPAAVVEDDDEDEDRPKAKAKAKKKAVVEDDDDDDGEDRPRKKGKKAAGGPPWLLIRLAILLFVGAVVIAGVYFYKKGETDAGRNTNIIGEDPAGKAGGSRFVELNDPIGGFSVLLPGTAAKADSPIPGLTGSTWKVSAADPKPVTVRVGSLTLPPGVMPAGGANAAAALAQLDPRMINNKVYKKEKQ